MLHAELRSIAFSNNDKLGFIFYKSIIVYDKTFLLNTIAKQRYLNQFLNDGLF